jgi:hypothetical protein
MTAKKRNATKRGCVQKTSRSRLKSRKSLKTLRLMLRTQPRSLSIIRNHNF